MTKQIHRLGRGTTYKAEELLDLIILLAGGYPPVDRDEICKRFLNRLVRILKI
jgi:hypothetical protein